MRSGRHEMVVKTTYNRRQPPAYYVGPSLKKSLFLVERPGGYILADLELLFPVLQKEKLTKRCTLISSNLKKKKKEKKKNLPSLAGQETVFSKGCPWPHVCLETLFCKFRKLHRTHSKFGKAES